MQSTSNAVALGFASLFVLQTRPPITLDPAQCPGCFATYAKKTSRRSIRWPSYCTLLTVQSAAAYHEEVLPQQHRVWPTPAHHQQGVATPTQQRRAAAGSTAPVSSSLTARRRRSGRKGTEGTRLSAAKLALPLCSYRHPQDHSTALFKAQRYPEANFTRSTDTHPTHKTRRLAWALARVERPKGIKSYRVHHMYNNVHLDEKWFNLYKANTKYYLAKDECLPYRSCPNKRFIGKVMFLAAMARPRYDFSKKRYFDGKIGVWPIIEQTFAQRGSKNRSKGAPITKTISMTRKAYTKMLLEKVFPAIREKWPGKWI
ncbi:hypothetical protein JG688_00016665 [Phytophthora aleatoria]|uniref:Uncharacterized protein n=1 Tax=Phytophthora aleatoria TaxID=2496075 RepID=A0A8J5ITS2_9STRA|nr:hypothetical protein JG688_00016665 [Phytophthora aleatoria]